MSVMVETTEVPTAAAAITATPPIVHIVERLAPGGIETLVLDIAAASQPAHLVISLQGDAGTLRRAWPRLRDGRVPLEAFGRSGLDPRLVLRLARHLRQLRPRAVFAHHMGPLVYGGLAARLAGVRRLILVEHDAWHLDNPREAKLARWCARVLRPSVAAVSEQVAGRAREVMAGRPVSVVPPGVATDRFVPADKVAARQRLGLPLDAKIIGAVGRLSAVKAHAALIEAVATQPSDLILVLVGDGPERPKLEALASTLGIADRVRFLGLRDDLEAIYPAFDLLCQPSLAEGLPRTILEAQSCGVPVIATKVGGMPEAVCPRTGVLIEPGDAAGLQTALLRALAQLPDVSPRAFVDGKYSLASTVQAYTELAGG
jgi:glycosyltransferase involved in cell wall biosynthesis